MPPPMSPNPTPLALGSLVGARVRELRLRRGLTDVALAGRLSEYHPLASTMNLLWIAALEAGEVDDMRLSDLAALAAALRCTPARLLPEHVPAAGKRTAKEGTP